MGGKSKRVKKNFRRSLGHGDVLKFRTVYQDYKELDVEHIQRIEQKLAKELNRFVDDVVEFKFSSTGGTDLDMEAVPFFLLMNNIIKKKFENNPLNYDSKLRKPRYIYPSTINLTVKAIKGDDTVPFTGYLVISNNRLVIFLERAGAACKTAEEVKTSEQTKKEPTPEEVL